MGVQRQNLTPGFPFGKSQGKKGQGGKGFFSKLNELPRLLNLVHYQMKAEQGQPTGEELDYEPIHLHITPSEVHPIIAAITEKTNHLNPQAPKALNQELELENFRFLMEQVPAVRTIEFSGRQDPFRNADLIAMVNYAHKYNGAESTVFTDGFLLNIFADQILKSSLRSLVVRLYEAKPSQYSRMSGFSPSRFVNIRDNLARLVQRKKALGSQVEIEVSFCIDIHNFREMPAMLKLAEELGVDGVRFENFLSPDPSVRSDRTLVSDMAPVVKYLKEFAEGPGAASPIAVVLPTLLEPDMSSNRNCLDPFTTVTVDTQLNISGCSRLLLYRGKMGKIWDQDFWNNDMYKWLRGVHSKSQSQTADVPRPCQNCPRNLSCGK